MELIKTEEKIIYVIMYTLNGNSKTLDNIIPCFPKSPRNLKSIREKIFHVLIYILMRYNDLYVNIIIVSLNSHCKQLIFKLFRWLYYNFTFRFRYFIIKQELFQFIPQLQSRLYGLQIRMGPRRSNHVLIFFFLSFYFSKSLL